MSNRAERKERLAAIRMADDEGGLVSQGVKPLDQDHAGKVLTSTCWLYAKALLNDTTLHNVPGQAKHLPPEWVTDPDEELADSALVLIKYASDDPAFVSDVAHLKNALAKTEKQLHSCLGSTHDVGLNQVSIEGISGSRIIIAFECEIIKK